MRQEVEYMLQVVCSMESQMYMVKDYQIATRAIEGKYVVP